ncbi:37675_t:CDS:10, partial [Gigaspora margarita]
VEIACQSINLLGIGISNNDYEYKGRKSKQKVSPKSRKKRPTIFKVSKLRYTLEKETPIIFTCKNSTILINAACKNTIEAYLNLEKKLLESEKKSQEKEIEEIDQITLLQKTVDEINAEKDIPKELIESLKAELNRATAIEINSQFTEKANSAKKVKSEIDSPDKDKYSKIDIAKEDILNIRWNLKPLEDNRTDASHDSGISCQNKVDLVKNAQSTENLEDKTPTKKEYRKVENRIIINKIRSNIAIYRPRIEVKGNKTYDLTIQGLYCQDEINLRRTYKDCNKKISNAEEIRVKKDEHEVFKKMKHVDETIEGYFKNRTSIEADIGSNSTNDLERTCESKDKDQNETKKQEEHGQANLNFLCKTWMNKIEIFKRMIKYPYEPKDPESNKIADTVQNAETSRKDKAQWIQPLQNLKKWISRIKGAPLADDTIIDSSKWISLPSNPDPNCSYSLFLGGTKINFTGTPSKYFWDIFLWVSDNKTGKSYLFQFLSKAIDIFDTINFNGEIPNERTYHTAVLNGRIIIYSRTSNKVSDYPAYPHLVVLNILNYEWSALPEINSIRPIALHTSIIIKNYMIVAFGQNLTNDKLISSIYKLDISNPSIYKWSLLSSYNDYISFPKFLYNHLAIKIFIARIVFLVVAILKFLFKKPESTITSNQSDYGSITPA